MKYLIVLILPFLLLACSKVGVGYSLGTSQINSKVDDAFEFSPRSKSKDVDKFLSAEFSKNKKIFFVKLKEQLHKLEALSVKSDLTAADADQLHTESLAFQKDMILLFKPSFNKVMTEVGDAEIKVFKDYSSEQISEREEQAENKKAFRKKKLSNITRVAEFILDDLTKEQEALAAKFIDEHIDFYAQQIQLRKKFNADFIKLYPQKDKMLDLSLAYYSGDTSIRTDDYKKQRDSFELDMKNLIVSLWKMRTKEQTIFFQKRLKEIITEVDKIISE